MGDGGTDITRALFDQLSRRFDQRAAGDGEVINDDRGLALDIANDFHDLRPFIVAVTLFVANRQPHAQIGGILVRLFGKADIRRDNDHILQLLLFNRITEELQGVKIVDRHMKEAL